MVLEFYSKECHLFGIDLSLNISQVLETYLDILFNFFMTIIGIGGSLALVFTGLGLLDSISSVAEIQFNEIITYDFSIDINNNVDNDLLLFLVK